jgi:uncharacterized protein (DUF1684 family)
MRKTLMCRGLDVSLGVSLVLVAVLATVGGCGGGDKSGDSGSDKAPGAMVMDQVAYESWEIALVEMRIEKNEEFSNAQTSPLLAASIPEFNGLNYYFPKAELRFHTPFVAAAGTDTVSLTKRKGNIVKYIRRGTVTFSHLDAEHTLPIFGPADTAGGNYLWLPFTDATSGKDSYAGGRYLDITLDAEGMVDLDFNYAYNPLCDYNAEKYNCTLPPAESHLGFAVEAGEKIFGAGH